MSLAVKFNTTLRNAIANAVETTIGTSPTLQIRTGSPPAGPDSAASGTLLATVSVPSDWLTDASSGAKSKSGTWTATAVGTGDVGHWRMMQGSTCFAQGHAGLSGASMTVSALALVPDQTFTVSTVTVTAGNA
jgi:hypothetical protein